LWSSSGGIQDLGILTDSSCQAIGINDAGQVAGNYTTSGPISHTRAFLYTPGGGVAVVPLLPGGEDNEARAINNAGQVAGLSDSSTTPYNHRDHAFLYTPGVGVQDLGFLPGSQTEISWANGLNNLGQVVGMSTTENLWINHPVLWSGGIHDLGALDPESGGEANAINNLGQVVGGASLPFLYSGGHMYSLNSLVQNLPEGIYLTGASGINDRGQIAATSLDSHAYLLTPCLAQPALDLLLLD
jgi:probable HAF family extracellular repeat protein